MGKGASKLLPEQLNELQAHTKCTRWPMWLVDCAVDVVDICCGVKLESTSGSSLSSRSLFFPFLSIVTLPWSLHSTPLSPPSPILTPAVDKKEIQAWYKSFLAEAPHGYLTKTEIYAMYQQYFPFGDPIPFADRTCASVLVCWPLFPLRDDCVAYCVSLDG